MILVALGSVAASTAVAAAEDVSPLRFEAGTADFALKGGESDLKGGVKIWYDQARIEADVLHYAQSPLPGAKEDVLERFSLEPGPKGPSPDRVLIDNSLAQMPNVGFRGRLTPRRVEAVRQPTLSSDKQVRFRVELSGLDYYTVQVRGKDGWMAYIGWADHAQIALIADLSGAGLANYRFETVHFYGAEAQPGEPYRQTKLVSLIKPSADPTMVEEMEPKREKARLHDNVLSMVFDEHGDLVRFQTSENNKIWGDPQAFTHIQRKSRLK